MENKKQNVSGWWKARGKGTTGRYISFPYLLYNMIRSVESPVPASLLNKKQVSDILAQDEWASVLMFKTSLAAVKKDTFKSRSPKKDALFIC